MDQTVWTLPDAPEITFSSAVSGDHEFSHLAWSDPVALMPGRIDLGAPEAFASLRPIDAVWPDLWEETQRNCLSRLRVVIPPPQLPEAGFALLPGGAVVVLDPRGVLCCDPADATTLRAAEAREVYAALIANPNVPTLLHTADGVVMRARMPDIMSRQAVTIVENARRLPGRAACGSQVLIQWCAGGATVWPLVLAPQCIALAAGVAAAPVIADRPPVPPVAWSAPNADARFQLLAPRLGDHVADLLDTLVCDDLRNAIVALCTDPEDSIASQLADAMALLPACFYADPCTRPGEPTCGWDMGTALMRHASGPCVMLGIEATSNVERAVHALRDAIEDPHAAMFAVSQRGKCSSLVSLVNDAALREVLPDGTSGRIGVLITPPHGPLELYDMITRIAEQAGSPAVASAPCWGYCHRVAPNGVESGNAAWFGGGVGLDEIDALVNDIAHWG
jgi:hypothetical protein